MSEGSRQQQIINEITGLRILQSAKDRGDVPDRREVAWLVERTGLPDSTIRDAIKRGPTRSEVAVKIANALEVDLDWLLTGATASNDKLRTRRTYGQLLDDIDELVEARRDDDIRDRRAELQALAADPDAAPEFRDRADYMLSLIGDTDARLRRRTTVRTITATRDGARANVEMALDRAIVASGVDIGEGARQALLALAGQLLLSSPADAAPEALQWSFESLLAAIGARYGGALSAPSIAAGASLHGRRDDFRGKDE